MIDKENEVYSRVREAVLAEYPNAYVDSSYQPDPAEFPHVAFFMRDVYAPREALDSTLHPAYVSMMFEAQVYTNQTSGKKTTAKKIMNIIIDTMAEMNMRVITNSPIQNLNDSSIYRLTARFEGNADSDNFYSK